MQGERVVAGTPAVAYVGEALDDDGVAAELGQACGQREPGVAAADDRDLGLAVLIASALLALLQPALADVLPVEVGTVGLGLASVRCGPQ